MPNKKKVCVAFLGNPSYDSRVTNLSQSLINDGHEVNVIGFDWQTPDFKSQNTSAKIFKLTKRKFSILFYLHFAFILMKELSASKADIYFAEDIYTLPFVVLWAKLRGERINYESRELYAHLGGLRNRKILQKVITSIERYFIKRVSLVITTGKMDSEFLQEFYGIENTVELRNLPILKQSNKIVNLRERLGISESEKILLYQGVILDGRGLFPTLKAMEFIPNVHLIILGQGEKEEKLKDVAYETGISNRVHFLGMIDQKDLIHYTSAADVGLALIENISVSYYYALPNKLFEYIMAGVPVICSNLPQMKEIVDNYKVGVSIDLEKEENLIDLLKEFLSDNKKLDEYKSNCITARQDLNWETEFNKIKYALIGDE